MEVETFRIENRGIRLNKQYQGDSDKFKAGNGIPEIPFFLLL